MGVTCKICPDIANNTAYTVLDATVRGQINSDTFSIKSNFSLSFLIWPLGIHSKELAIFFYKKTFFSVTNAYDQNAWYFMCMTYREYTLTWPNIMTWTIVGLSLSIRALLPYYYHFPRIFPFGSKI